MPNWMFEPLVKTPSRIAKKLADKIDNPQGEGGRFKGFLAGATEGVGDLISDMGSPASIGMSLAGLGGLKHLMKFKKLANVADDIPNLVMPPSRLGAEFTPIGSEALENAMRTSQMEMHRRNLTRVAREASEANPNRKWSDPLMLEENRSYVSAKKR